ncbi:MAG: exo-alpha-sialidase [Armatimonadetes bacterium]|nr:exo-alpha-sialidase [Armatimonadota bacterium]
MDDLTKLRSQLAEMTTELEELYKPDENGGYAPDFTQKCDKLRASMRELEKRIAILDPGAFASNYRYELPPETNAPKGSHSLIAVTGDRTCARNSEQAVIELKDGRLLLGWSEFYEGAGDDWAPSRIAQKFSSDGGVTWSQTSTLLENEGKQGTMEVDFLRMPSGDICLFYCRKNSNDDLRVMMRKSKDDGKTWGESRRISDWHGYVGTTNDRSILTSKGRIILPFWYSVNDAFMEPWYSVCQVFYSDDAGDTWGISRPALSAPYSSGGSSEPAVVELSDGSILMFMRNTSGRIWQSVSSDGGVRWERPTPTDLAASGSPICMKRIPGRTDIMVIWSQCSKAELEWDYVRNRLSCAISSDDGKTWGHFKNLESLDDVAQVHPTPVGDTPKCNIVIWGSPMPPSGPLNCSYPSLTFVGNKAIICYDFPTGYCGIKMRILPISWFYDDSAPSLRTLYPDGRTDRDLYELTQTSSSPKAYGNT